MKKISKIFIVSFLLVIMIMNHVFARSIYNDVENTKYEEAVVNLVELGIFKETSDPNFGIDQKVTKAEMAEILVKCLALDDVVNGYKGKTKYKDVSADHKLSGYINMIAELKTMDINSDGNFYPDKNITSAEAITYCIKMLGYGDIVDTEGTWPTNYLLKAVELEILDGISLKSTEEIKKGDLSILLWNVLNTKM